MTGVDVRDLFLAARRADPVTREALLSSCEPEVAEEVRSLLRYAPPSDAVSLLASPRSERIEPDSVLPVRVGRYEVVRRLGAGGMGEVFLAVRGGDVPSRVAIKLLRSDIGSPRLVRRFEQERRTLASLDHDCIARVLDAGTAEDGRAFFAMEYVEGACPITDHCDRERLGIEDRLELFGRVVDAVQHAHQRGVIHRDLKPGNTLVRAVDGGHQVKLIDFGIARLMREDASRLTGDHHVLGTPGYMSPEQRLPGHRPVDVRADVYSLGVLLVELLVGVSPWDESDGLRPSRAFAALVDRDRDVAQRRAAQRGASPRQLAKTVAGELDWICERATRHAPGDRFSSAAELGDAVARFRSGGIVITSSGYRWYRLRKHAVRYRVALAGLGVAFAALVVGLLLQQAALAKLDAVNMAVLLTDLERAADESLWPLGPECREDCEKWLASAAEIARRLPALEAERARVPVEQAEWWRQGRSSQSAAETFERQVGPLVARVRRLVDGRQPGTLLDATMPAVRQRLQLIDEVDHLTHSGSEAEEAWLVAERYARASLGMRLPRVWGLLPLGPDPDSGLLEFAHVASGVCPVRGEGGKLSLDARSAIVFVLLPGSGGEGSPAVEPFLIAKHELTQAQWLRLAGDNPSAYRPGDPILACSLMHPVESVSWGRALMVLDRFRMKLPTWSQWTYAYRGGAATKWYFGDDEDDCQRYANVLDQSNWSLSGQMPWNDGWPAHAPVGRFLPNAFGLHDIAGNVWEYLADGYVGAPEQTWPKPPFPSHHRLSMGGAWGRPAVGAVADGMNSHHERAHESTVGIRPTVSLPVVRR